MGQKKKDALIQFNKDNIMNAAKVMFEKKGIQAATVDDIAKEADCSKSTVYVYFKSKDEILNYIILEEMTKLKTLLTDCIREEMDFLKCYQRICQKLVAYQEQYPAYYDLLLGEIQITDQDILENTVCGQIYVVGEQINDVIEQVLVRGMESGQVRKDIKIVETVFYLWSGISETIRFARKKQQYFKIRLGMEKQEYMEYAFSLLLKGIQP